MGKGVTIIGHDPSLTGYGLAAINVTNGKPTLIDSEIFSTDASTPTAQRYLEIYRWAVGFVTNHKPYMVGIETVPSFAKLGSSAQVAEITGIGVVASAPHEPVRVTASTAKRWVLPNWPGLSKANWAAAGRTTKYKRSMPDKNSVINELYRRFRFKLTDLNASDAALVALWVVKDHLKNG